MTDEESRNVARATADLRDQLVTAQDEIRDLRAALSQALADKEAETRRADAWQREYYAANQHIREALEQRDSLRAEVERLIMQRDMIEHSRKMTAVDRDGWRDGHERLLTDLNAARAQLAAAQQEVERLQREWNAEKAHAIELFTERNTARTHLAAAQQEVERPKQAQPIDVMDRLRIETLKDQLAAAERTAAQLERERDEASTCFKSLLIELWDGVRIHELWAPSQGRDGERLIHAYCGGIVKARDRAAHAEAACAAMQASVDEVCASILAEFMFPTMDGWEARSEESRQEWRAIFRDKVIGKEQPNGTNGWLAQRVHQRLIAALAPDAGRALLDSIAARDAEIGRLRAEVAGLRGAVKCRELIESDGKHEANECDCGCAKHGGDHCLRKCKCGGCDIVRSGGG